MKQKIAINRSLVAISFIAAFLIVACDQVAQPQQTQCVLYQNLQTNDINCFRQNQQPANWTPYQKPEIGIPYACYVENGECQLAQ